MRRVHARIENRDGRARAVVAGGPCLIALNQRHALGQDGPARARPRTRATRPLTRRARRARGLRLRARRTERSRIDGHAAVARLQRGQDRASRHRCRGAARRRRRRFAVCPSGTCRSEEPARRSLERGRRARRARAARRALVVRRRVDRSPAPAPTERCRRARKKGGPRGSNRRHVLTRQCEPLINESGVPSRSFLMSCQGRSAQFVMKSRAITRWVERTRTRMTESECRSRSDGRHLRSL